MNKTIWTAVLSFVAFIATTASAYLNGTPVDWPLVIGAVTAVIGAFHVGHAAGTTAAAAPTVAK